MFYQFMKTINHLIVRFVTKVVLWKVLWTNMFYHFEILELDFKQKQFDFHVEKLQKSNKITLKNSTLSVIRSSWKSWTKYALSLSVFSKIFKVSFIYPFFGLTMYLPSSLRNLPFKNRFCQWTRYYRNAPLWISKKSIGWFYLCQNLEMAPPQLQNCRLPQNGDFLESMYLWSNRNNREKKQSSFNSI